MVCAPLQNKEKWGLENVLERDNALYYTIFYQGQSQSALTRNKKADPDINNFKFRSRELKEQTLTRTDSNLAHAKENSRT
jgi:hypothetical protein